jgi:serine/threonine-protein kinase
VFTPHYTTALMQVSDGGGEPTPLTTLDADRGERTHRWPQAVPGEDLVLFTVGAIDTPESYDGARIDAVRPSTGERKTVLEGASMARYVPTGHLLFGREGFLFAVAFDIDRLETKGSPFPVLENVMGMRNSGLVHAGFSRTGLLAYVEGSAQSRESRLVWRYRDGRSEPLAAPIAGYSAPRLSPDRQRIAAAVAGDTNFDIWTYALERGALTRLTFEGDNTWPVWSPDGRRIAFASIRNDALMSTYVKSADGSGETELLLSPETHQDWGQTIPRSWSPDGRVVLLEFTNQQGSNILAISVEDKSETFRMETPASEHSPALSPDGRWLAYGSDESGRFEVYVRPFPESGGRWQISTDGGTFPRWAPDGRSLFYRRQTRLMAVSVDLEQDTVRADPPQVVFDDLRLQGTESDYDALDDRTFLVVEPVGSERAAQGVTVLVNWLDQLGRRDARR